MTNIFFFSVRFIKEELMRLQEPGSYVGEVVKPMGKKKILVKVSKFLKTSENFFSDSLRDAPTTILIFNKMLGTS
jgi:ATP-dependent 26S proteasome regulatory subunit